MGKFFIPMYRYTTTPYQTKRPQRGLSNYAVGFYDQPLLFDTFMASLLGQLCNKTREERNKKDSVSKQPKSPWIYGVNLKGFNPDDISVKVKDGTVHISARQVEETKSGYDTFERFRKVPLPEEVDDEKLSCFSKEDGKLILTAPYVRQKQDAPNEKEPMSVVDNSPPESKTDSRQKESSKAEPVIIEVPIKHQDTEPSTEDDSQVIYIETEPEQNMDSVETRNRNEDQENDRKDVQEQSKSESGDEIMNTDMPAENGLEILELKNNASEHNENTNDQRHVEIPTESPMVLEDKQKNETEMKHVDEHDDQVNIKPVESELDFPLIDSTIVKEVDGTNQFEMNLNLKGFSPENTKIQLKNDWLHIDAEKEIKMDSFVSYQKVQKNLSVPKSCLVDRVKAEMNKDGILRVTVPLK